MTKKTKHNKVVHAKSYTIIHTVLNMYETEMGYIFTNKIKQKIV